MKTGKKERERLIKIYGHKYKRHFTNEGYKCFYCGETAQCLDHVPALSTLEGMPKDYLRKNEIPCRLIPACSDCNRALGNKNMPYIMDRLLYLESYYEKLLQKKRALWSEDELAEMGYAMQEVIRHSQEILHIYVDKIRAIQMRQIKPETFPTYNSLDLDDEGE